MDRRRALLLAASLTLAPRLARAQAAQPPPQAPLTAVEQAFYESASQALRKLYPTPAKAENLGWFRYNNEDRTGAISYMNVAYFDTPMPTLPSQLWYDVNGRLIGADFTQTPAHAPNGPTLFGLERSRFHHVPLHVHYGLYRPDGSVRRGISVGAAAYQAAAGDPLHPTPDGLVKLGKAATTAEVAFVFPLLENWDAQMWVIPNAAGQFADANPAVKPSASGGGSGETQG